MRFFTQFINSFPGLRALPIPPIVLAGALLYLLCGCAGGGASSGGGPAQPHSISGTVAPSGSGVTVTLSGTSTGTTTTDGSGYYSFNGLANGTYVVTPSRAGSNFSPTMQTVALSGPGSTANFSASQGSGHSVQLSWKASSSSVSGYNVYRGTTDGGPYTKMNTQLITASTFTDNTVNSGNTYYYVSTSVDPGGRESQFSTQATAKVP